MGKPKLSAVTSARRVIYGIYSHTVTLNKVMMTDVKGPHDETLPLPEPFTQTVQYGWFTPKITKHKEDEKCVSVVTASVGADWGDSKQDKGGRAGYSDHLSPPSSRLKWDLQILSQCRPTTCKTQRAVEGSKAALIPRRSHIPPLSPLVYLSFRNTWNALILLAPSCLHRQLHTSSILESHHMQTET